MTQTIPLILRELPSELRGTRVLVRPYAPGDGPALHEAVEESREHLRPWMDWVDTMRTVDDCEAYVRRAYARWFTREDLAVGMWDATSGRYLGGSGLHSLDWSVPTMEIGYWIRASAQGGGYVAEAVRLLCDLAFSTLGANRVSLYCDANNVRSANVARRVGFIHEGTMRNDRRTPAGELRDTMGFALTPADYARLG